MSHQPKTTQNKNADCSKFTKSNLCGICTNVFNYVAVQVVKVPYTQLLSIHVFLWKDGAVKQQLLCIVHAGPRLRQHIV